MSDSNDRAGVGFQLGLAFILDLSSKLKIDEKKTRKEVQVTVPKSTQTG